MNLNSPFFNRIRIKPAADAPQEVAGPVCEHPACRLPGEFRAPKGRDAEGKYWKFCLNHVREYNASYNYFAGMSDNAVQAFQKDAVIGHRPTWAMGMNPTIKPVEGSISSRSGRATRARRGEPSMCWASMRPPMAQPSRPNTRRW
jgi:hypothetical protein